VVAGLWILLSDQAVKAIWPDPGMHHRVQSFKGLFFVGFTGLLLYVLMYARGLQQNRAQRELRQSEEHYRGTVELAGVGIAEADLGTCCFLEVNRKLCEILGYSESELMGTHIFDLTHPDDRDDAKCIAALTNATAGNVAYFEKRYFRKDGQIIWMRISGSVTRLDPDRPLRCVAFFEDITQQHAAQERLRLSEARFRELADAMPQMVFTSTPQGQPEYFNRRWQAYLGMTVEQALVKGWLSIIHPDDVDHLGESWFDAIAHGTPHQAEYRMRPAGGTVEYRWHLSRAVPSRDAEGKIVRWIGTITDIDAQKRTTQQVQQVNETLEQRVRERTSQLQAANEELDAFSYTVSHDLRTPLQHLQTFARSVLARSADTPPLDAEDVDKLRRILAMSVRMERLIVDLLEYSRIARSDLKPTPVSTVTIVHELVGQLQRDPETAKADIHFKEPLPWVLGNRLILQQVFANLIGNAIKFVTPGQTPYVNIWSEDRVGSARIWIEDRGIGIQPDHFDRIFQPFETAHASDLYSGPGIGLAVVKRAVERMGGQVGLESVAGRGTKFWIELPKVHAAT